MTQAQQVEPVKCEGCGATKGLHPNRDPAADVQRLHPAADVRHPCLARAVRLASFAMWCDVCDPDDDAAAHDDPDYGDDSGND